VQVVTGPEGGLVAYLKRPVPVSGDDPVVASNEGTHA